ncbi:hypothetical protein DB29_03476 [Shouchella clausii]|nr:hypothetical protein DB29_03476 [Shouchella clausii]
MCATTTYEQRSNLHIRACYVLRLTFSICLLVHIQFHLKLEHTFSLASIT